MSLVSIGSSYNSLGLRSLIKSRARSMHACGPSKNFAGLPQINLVLSLKHLLLMPSVISAHTVRMLIHMWL